MLRETLLVVITAMAAVSIPWLLVYNKILNPQVALSLFIVFCFLLYTVIWKQIKFADPLVFIKTLFRRNHAKKEKIPDAVVNLDLMMETS